MAPSPTPDNGEGPSSRYTRSSTPISNSGIRSESASVADGRTRSRQVSIARLTSPAGSFSGRQSPVPGPSHEHEHEHEQVLPSIENPSSFVGPGKSMLVSGLHDHPVRSASPRLGTPTAMYSPVKTNYGSVDIRPSVEGPENEGPLEDPEVVKRHLVLPDSRPTSSSKAGSHKNGGDEFSSLKLQGGDMTRQVYRWADHAENEAYRGRPIRSKSFSFARPSPESETMDINTIRVPGGFRRDYLRRNVGSPYPESIRGLSVRPAPAQPHLPTNNFLEFLTLYGHFAGEELEEDDEVLGPNEYFASDTWDETEGAGIGEETALLQRHDAAGRRLRKPRGGSGNSTRLGAAMLLLKSFMGTGALFLPRAFLNGGMLFSCLVLLFVSILSYYCFILLVNTRMQVDGSFGDMGGILYGKHVRRIILTSIVVSQLGFVAAYTVFTAENLQAFVLAISKCKSFIDIKFMILLQAVIFLPLSLVRDISKLGFTALIADLFILLGLVYLYYYDASAIANHGVAEIQTFNSSSWTLFIGTAIFTFEGIGLILPIQESMKHPQQFPGILALIMIIITTIFLSVGALSYAAYGPKTKTVVLLNLPQGDKFVNAAQLLYSLAILLSTPLQLFPAIRIMENEMFTRSGKYNPSIKWKKNCFRFFLVMLCALVAWGGAADLDKFVSIVGSFACVPLVYVYPPLLHLRGCARSRRQKVADMALACFGMVACVYTTALTLSNWVAGEVEQTPGYCDS